MSKRIMTSNQKVAIVKNGDAIPGLRKTLGPQDSDESGR